MEFKNLLEIAFESFLNDHKEYYKEHDFIPVSPHKPRYSYINTSADEEFNVHSILSSLNDKEIYFLFALMTEIGNEVFTETLQ